jgi:hypothetical protein
VANKGGAKFASVRGRCAGLNVRIHGGQYLAGFNFIGKSQSGKSGLETTNMSSRLALEMGIHSG